MSNTTLTDREKAIQWWNNKLTVWDRNELIYKHYPNYVAGSIDKTEIENMWRKEIQSDREEKETSPTPSTESGELKCTKGNWYVYDGHFILSDDKPKNHIRVGQSFVSNVPSYDNNFAKDSEGIANAQMFAASKDMYNAIIKTLSVFAPCNCNDEQFQAIHELYKASRKANPNLK